MYFSSSIVPSLVTLSSQDMRVEFHVTRMARIWEARMCRAAVSMCALLVLVLHCCSSPDTPDMVQQTLERGKYADWLTMREADTRKSVYVFFFSVKADNGRDIIKINSPE